MLKLDDLSSYTTTNYSQNVIGCPFIVRGQIFTLGLKDSNDCALL